MISGLLLCIVAAVPHDGDGLRCTDGTRIRIARIQAPDFERSEPCRKRRPNYVCDDELARASRDNLRRIVKVGSRVRYSVIDADPCRRGFQKTDPFGRPVARVYLRGLELGREQLRGGFAVKWKCR